jgi:hypothetical protein
MSGSAPAVGVTTLPLLLPYMYLPVACILSLDEL